MAGFKLQVSEEGNLGLGRQGRSAIPLTKWGQQTWKREVKEHINNELIKDLHEAVAPAKDEEGRELKPRRKDMVGLSGCVDRYATTALRKQEGTLQHRAEDPP